MGAVVILPIRAIEQNTNKLLSTAIAQRETPRRQMLLGEKDICKSAVHMIVRHISAALASHTLPKPILNNNESTFIHVSGPNDCQLPDIHAMIQRQRTSR
jgi:hypothetical protein